jgi:serine/threonine-protein kinase
MVCGGQAMIVSKKAAPDLAGTVLEGAYRLVRLIGQGGMGAVYEAVQLRLQKRVAIKLMMQTAISDQISLARFHREAQVTSRLGHPHLVNVVDFGTAETGQPYMVMEYLEGEDLEQRLRRCKRLPPETVAFIVAQTASALGAAHAQDVVHRDMKPGNIFLLNVPGEPEFVKVLDFGISKIKAANAKRLTSDRMVVGTPYYMSPEQATGRADDVDHRADQWALACIAWEALRGRPPFSGDDVTAVMYQITRLDPPSLCKDVPNLRPEAEESLRRALCKRHEERYDSIREFARAFQSAVLGYSTELTPLPAPMPTPGQLAAQNTTPEPIVRTTYIVRRRVTRWSVIAGASVLALVSIVFATVRARSPASNQPEAAASAATSPSPAGSQPAARVEVVPLPANPTPGASPTEGSKPTPVAGRSPHAAAQKHAKPKTSYDLGSHTDATSKAKPARTKHRLFEKL